MERNELIAKVALHLIKQEIANEPEGTLRFCIAGIEKSIVCAIAMAVRSDRQTPGVC